jgi:hypothetical protein
LEHKDKRLAQLEEMKSESDLQLKNSKVVQNESNEKNK